MYKFFLYLFCFFFLLHIFYSFAFFLRSFLLLLFRSFLMVKTEAWTNMHTYEWTHKNNFTCHIYLLITCSHYVCKQFSKGEKECLRVICVHLECETEKKRNLQVFASAPATILKMMTCINTERVPSHCWGNRHACSIQLCIVVLYQTAAPPVCTYFTVQVLNWIHKLWVHKQKCIKRLIEYTLS